MTKHKNKHTTGDYEDWLIHSLKNKKESAAYLQVALEEYKKDDNLKVFLRALRYIAKARERTPGSLKGKIKIADDFDAPLPEDLLNHFLGK